MSQHGRNFQGDRIQEKVGIVGDSLQGARKDQKRGEATLKGDTIDGQGNEEKASLRRRLALENGHSGLQ
jgi:hypothetical protein